jgi:hypothetical protein
MLWGYLILQTLVQQDEKETKKSAKRLGPQDKSVAEKTAKATKFRVMGLYGSSIL